MFRELLVQRVSAFCSLSSAQVDQLQQHYELMLKWNKVTNLTRIEGVEDAVNRHYAESLFLGSVLPPGPLQIADIGSGAGFPGLPLAVLRAESQVTLIESHQRKAVFLKEACRGLPNVSVVSKRAEDVSREFDWVVSRAVSWEDLQGVVFRLAPNVALLVSDPQISFPWDKDRGVQIVSRETSKSYAERRGRASRRST